MVRRRKAKADRKESEVRVLLTTEQKRTLLAAAAKAGLDLSTWMRFVALRETGK